VAIFAGAFVIAIVSAFIVGVSPARWRPRALVALIAVAAGAEQGS